MNESLLINKNIQSGSKSLNPCSLYQGCLLHGKSIPVLPWPNGTHGHSGDSEHPSGILGVYDQSGVLTFAS